MQDRDLESLVRAVVERVLDAPPGAESCPAARRVAIGADHGGFPLKQELLRFLPTLGWEPLDLGTHSTDPVDYPDVAAAVARAVVDGRAGYGVMIDGAGIGSCMAANKIPGVRAALCYDLSTAANARAPSLASPSGSFPARPFASTTTVSLVLVSPSTVTILKERSTLRRKAASRNEGATAASVVMKASMVPMFG